MTGWTMNDPRLTFDEASHAYTLGERRLVSVTQALGIAGVADFSSPWFTEAVKARGTFLHEAIALDVEGDLDDDTLDEELRGGVEGWRKFVADTGAVVEHWETALCDPSAGVAGRMDGVIRLHDPTGRTVRMVIDIKRALYPSAAIQLAAYADMAARLYDQPVYFKRAALVLPGDGSYRLHAFTDPLDRATWHAVLRIVQWRETHAG
jgi:hypothetical protein